MKKRKNPITELFTKGRQKPATGRREKAKYMRERSEPATWLKAAMEIAERKLIKRIEEIVWVDKVLNFPIPTFPDFLEDFRTFSHLPVQSPGEGSTAETKLLEGRLLPFKYSRKISSAPPSNDKQESLIGSEKLLFSASMENPFIEFPTFTNPYYEAPRPLYYNYPVPRSGAVFSPGTTRSVPVRNPSQLSPPPSQRKVVSVPVRFVGTEKSRAAAAVKIQKVLRGFLVRRAVGKVLSVATEVAEVERRVARKETVEMVRREEKERLRLNDMLMGLLFRLDSIRGFDSGVRDCRKRVIRRVIALQERLDAIAAGGMVEEEDGAESESTSRTGCRKDTIADGDMVVEDEEDETDSGNCSPGEERVDAIAAGDMEEEKVVRTDSPNCSRQGEEVTASYLSDQPAADENQGVEVVGDGRDDKQSADLTDIAADSAPLEQTPESMEPERGGQNSIKDDKEMEDRQACDNFRSVMEKMVGENVKLQRLVADLCEKNALQSRLINALSQRVEQLEKVMAKKKKKKRQATGTEEDLKKCGKKL